MFIYMYCKIQLTIIHFKSNFAPKARLKCDKTFNQLFNLATNLSFSKYLHDLLTSFKDRLVSEPKYILNLNVLYGG